MKKIVMKWYYMMAIIFMFSLNESIYSDCLSLESKKSTFARRHLLSKVASSFLAGTTIYGTTKSPFASAFPSLEGYAPNDALTSEASGRTYFPTITPPFTNRATYRYDLGRGAWALEQLLTFQNVTATIRTIVQKSKTTGKLWINGPLYPTGEYCKLLDELGEVEHVVLPCNALEHKAPMKAFLEKYPKVKSVWISPGQYSVFGSCGLDLSSCRMPYRVDGVLPLSSFVSSSSTSSSSSSLLPPWSDEFEFRTLYLDLPRNAGPVSETAFYHKPSRTLITTDSVIFVPNTPPPILKTYFTNPDDTSNDDFWPKTVLQSIFLPLRQDKSNTIIGSDYDHTTNWPGYNAIRNRLIRAPILRAFADARAPVEIRQWVQEVSTMGQNNGDTNTNTNVNANANADINGGFDRILTAHFASPIQATPNDFLSAFTYLDPEFTGDDDDDSAYAQAPLLPKIACQDWELLQSLNRFIDDNQLGAPTIYDYKKGCISP